MLRPRSLFAVTGLTLTIAMGVFLLISLSAITYYILAPVSRQAADDLAALPIRRLMERNPGLDPLAIDDVYLIGICGTGMGSLAGLFHEAGYGVRGSDAATWPPMLEPIRKVSSRPGFVR